MPTRKKLPSKHSANQQSVGDNESKSKSEIPFDFEKSLAELEKIVQRMERGEHTLQHTLQDFERGMMLTEQCQKSLQAAQQRVDVLVKRHGSYQLQPLESLDEDEDEDEESEA